jgi:predicted dehydrogenase
MELGSHHFDLFRFYFGQDVRAVSAEIRSIRTEDDTAMVHLLLADGLQIQSFFSLSAVDEDRFEIIGDAGTLSLDRYRSLQVEIVRGGKKFSPMGQALHIMKSFSGIPYLYRKMLAPWHEPSYQDALTFFLDAIRGRVETKPDLQDGYRSLEIVCAAEQAAQAGHSVSLVPSGGRS